ncbi:docking protein 3 isoform X2 [Melanotaenia boesemani]|nr:docking protein 3 isoform X2 [Melanotaenia boesemani]
MGARSPGGDHGTGVWRHQQPYGDRKAKVVRLSELISVLRLPPNAEACPMENMSAFCVETQDRTLVFAAFKDECVDWVGKLCHSTFQRGASSESNQLHVEENQIYASADDVSQFWVVIQRTDAATRCGLQGSFWLEVGHKTLLLKETQKKNTVMEWPYELLRRYGKDKLALTIEAGRRCNSGPGTFSFETQQAEKIFSLIQNAIKLKTSPSTSGNQIQECEKVQLTNIRAHSPLPKIPDMTSMAAMLDSKLRTQDRRSPVFEDCAPALEGVVGQSEGSPAPITLMPLPLVPTHNRISRDDHDGRSDGIYAEPAKCVLSAAASQPTTALYVDPASILPLKPPGSRESTCPLSASTDPHLDSVYSEVFDKVSLVQDKLTVLPGPTKFSGGAEPIYSEPVSKAESESVKGESKPDPFAHLYAQVCKKPPSSSLPSTSVSTSASSATAGPDDVIYENLGII